MKVIYVYAKSHTIENEVNKKIEWIENQTLTPGDGTNPEGHVIDIKFSTIPDQDFDPYVAALILWDYKYF